MRDKSDRSRSQAAGLPARAPLVDATDGAKAPPNQPIKPGPDHAPPVAEVALAYRLHDVTLASHVALRRAKATAAYEVRELEVMLDDFTYRQRSTVVSLRRAGYVDSPEFRW